MPARDLYSGLESGEIDVAIGLFQDLSPGLYQQLLYVDRLVCVARKGHPAVTGKTSLRTFLSCSHVRVRSLGTGHYVAIEKAIGSSKQRKRRIALSVPHFLGLAKIIVDSDLIATIPERLAQVFAEQAEIQIVPLPFSAPNIEIKQHWHARFHHDPANRWLRHAIAALFMTSDLDRGTSSSFRLLPPNQEVALQSEH
jgi:DNA-binding transcriptional LysR family regulator